MRPLWYSGRLSFSTGWYVRIYALTNLLIPGLRSKKDGIVQGICKWQGTLSELSLHCSPLPPHSHSIALQAFTLSFFFSLSTMPPFRSIGLFSSWRIWYITKLKTSVWTTFVLIKLFLTPKPQEINLVKVLVEEDFASLTFWRFGWLLLSIRMQVL